LLILPVWLDPSLSGLYCQYGWTRHYQIKPDHISDWPTKEEVFAAVERSLSTLQMKPAFITFSGNGEPTMHPDFPEIVEAVIELRNKLAPESQTAILSNSSTVDKVKIRTALERLDVRIMKLDCGNNHFLKKYNLPCAGIEYEKIVSGLVLLDDVTIQSLFSDGISGNYHWDNISKWIEALLKIQPKLVQLYTLDRGYPSGKISPLSLHELKEIKRKLNEQNIRAEVYF